MRWDWCRPLQSTAKSEFEGLCTKTKRQSPSSPDIFDAGVVILVYEERLNDNKDFVDIGSRKWPRSDSDSCQRGGMRSASTWQAVQRYVKKGNR
jgi:hypothetical protein